MGNKVLYFEGAGWADADTSKATNVGNCRIRTAFVNNEGKKIYLEITQGHIYNQKKKNQIDRYYIHIDHVFYITDDKDNCNNNQIPFDWQELKKNYNYNIEDITKWINKYLNCNFDSIVVLPDLGGYSFADDFIYNKELTKKD